MKGTIHKFNGAWHQALSWDGQRSRKYHTSDVSGVTETWLIGKPEGAENFAVRYYKVEAGGFSHQECHPYDHGILVLHGEGSVQMGEERFPIQLGDILYIPPDMEHQLINTGQEPLGFLCIIPARRMKQGEMVWADEKISFD